VQWAYAIAPKAHIVLVATPPAETLACLRALSWRPDQALICVAIDVTRATLAAAAPGAIVLRAMPSNAAALGICPTPLYPAHAEAKVLLSRLGPVFELADERAFDAATALAGYHLWCYGLMEEVTRAAVAFACTITLVSASWMIRTAVRSVAVVSCRCRDGRSMLTSMPTAFRCLDDAR
jgi:pyrroline-5-carboxylate reductase